MTSAFMDSFSKFENDKKSIMSGRPTSLKIDLLDDSDSSQHFKETISESYPNKATRADPHFCPGRPAPRPSPTTTLSTLASLPTLSSQCYVFSPMYVIMASATTGLERSSSRRSSLGSSLGNSSPSMSPRRNSSTIILPVVSSISTNTEEELVTATFWGIRGSLSSMGSCDFESENPFSPITSCPAESKAIAHGPSIAGDESMETTKWVIPEIVIERYPLPNISGDNLSPCSSPTGRRGRARGTSFYIPMAGPPVEPVLNTAAVAAVLNAESLTLGEQEAQLVGLRAKQTRAHLRETRRLRRDSMMAQGPNILPPTCDKQMLTPSAAEGLGGLRFRRAGSLRTLLAEALSHFLVVEPSF